LQGSSGNESFRSKMNIDSMPVKAVLWLLLVFILVLCTSSHECVGERLVVMVDLLGGRASGLEVLLRAGGGVGRLVQIPSAHAEMLAVVLCQLLLSAAQTSRRQTAQVAQVMAVTSRRLVRAT
jgi:hypothetical protein